MQCTQIQSATKPIISPHWGSVIRGQLLCLKNAAGEVECESLLGLMWGPDLKGATFIHTLLSHTQRDGLWWNRVTALRLFHFLFQTIWLTVCLQHLFLSALRLWESWLKHRHAGLLVYFFLWDVGSGGRTPPFLKNVMWRCSTSSSSHTSNSCEDAVEYIVFLFISWSFIVKYSLGLSNQCNLQY